MSPKAWSIAILVCLSLCARAQDQTNFTQFYLNPYLINPSYVGIDGQSALSLTYRKQWTGIEGAPTIANFAWQAPVSARVGFGLSVTNDVKGLLNNSSVLLTFGYNVPVADGAFIRFGISGGGAWNMVDLEKLGSLNDDKALANLLENNASLTGNAGISFHIKTFQLGASMPTLFSPSYMSTEAFTVTEIKPFQSLIFNASNRFYFADDKHVFEPFALYRMNADLPPQFEFAGVFHLNHILWLGGSYKQDFGVSALAGIKLKNSLAIGASYNVQNSGLNELDRPGFELSLNVLFGKRKKNAQVYSFVNTVKEKQKKPTRKSASELIAEKRSEEEARKKQLEEQARERREAEETAKKEEQLARQRHDEAARQAEADHIAQIEAQRMEEETVRREALAQDNPPAAREPQEIVTPPVPEDNGRHETFKRGSHPSELSAGDYVIAGVFSTDANAARYTQDLLKLGYMASYGFLTQKQFWYVYVYRSDDIHTARAERDKYRKLRMFKDAWLLTIVDGN